MQSSFPPSMRNRLSFLLGKLYMRILELEGSALEPLGTNVKHHAVLTLLVDEGPMTQQEMGQRLGIDRTTIVAVVDGLEKENLVERRRSPADRRAYLLTLTPEGREAQSKGQRLVDAAERRLLSNLDRTERRALTTLLSKSLDTR